MTYPHFISVKGFLQSKKKTQLDFISSDDKQIENLKSKLDK